MTIDELLAECERAERWHAEKMPGAEPAFNIKIFRRCQGRRVRIMPGLMADLVQWADGDEPVCVGVLKCRDVRRVTGAKSAI